MRKFLSILFAIIAWFAIIAQYILMLNASTTGFADTSIRFFSFFTILTNILVAIYFTNQAFVKNYAHKAFLNKTGNLTSTTVYILVVGLVYQVILRKTWTFTGLNKIVNELLHSLIPILVLLFWYLYEEKSIIKWKSILGWLLYPLVYLIFILIRGYFTNYYPYPFVNVLNLGLSQVIINSLMIMILFITISSVLVGLGKKIDKD
ncbi:Pr6Pr family membrane protein [Pedobacter sp. SD-b]|uniref:Pr6Pr family membrane protein n=1 Tax=Pedobacter segetis TaxID=2793069 RepID=A0ABS1BM45_9SPHI|nr:Pr6Pr family membrane protein [Pedobacter segetis]MBK0383950.1 Pr6Pr family membrane protein [Pedobacter segetis]